MVDLNEIGIGRGSLKVGKDGKPAKVVYGSSNTDRAFVKRFDTINAIAKAEEEEEDRKRKQGSKARWFRKMDFSQPIMAEM